MSDYLIRLASNPMTRRAISAVGLPTPGELARADGPYAERPLAGQLVMLADIGGGRVAPVLSKALEQAGAEVVEAPAGDSERRLDAVVVDASGVKTPQDLAGLWAHLHPVMRRMNNNARILVTTGEPGEAAEPVQAACRRAVEGFTRSLAKEIGSRGATANMLYVADGAEGHAVWPMRFFLTGHSAYVDGQPVRVDNAAGKPGEPPLTRVLDGRTALVTGAARGIGAATAARLADEGANVVCLDIPAAEEALQATAAKIGGSSLAADITADDAPAKIRDFLGEKFGGVDVVVHNAGVTRDKKLANMPQHYWDMVLGINFEAVMRIDADMEDHKVLREGGRVVCLSSIGGIAGNVGQTNYGASKAGLIGYVQARAPQLAARGATINAVAPGFIETDMTAAMPFAIREGGRRMNAMSQGGQPIDVAELITFLGSPGAAGISGQTIRVCGQSLIGA